jgi:hypothetical protein
MRKFAEYPYHQSWYGAIPVTACNLIFFVFFSLYPSPTDPVRMAMMAALNGLCGYILSSLGKVTRSKAHRTATRLCVVYGAGELVWAAVLYFASR